MFRSTYRIALLVAGLATLGACDKTRDITAPATGGVVNPDPATNRLGVRGILRRAMDLPDTAWELELVDGSMLHLIGGPDDAVYAYLQDQPVFVIGHTTDTENTLVVESCVIDTQILVEFNRRPSIRR